MAISLVLAKLLTSSYVALHFYLGVNILTAIFALTLLKHDTPHHEESGVDTDKFSIMRYWPFWLSLLLMQVSFGGFYNFFTIYETAHGISLEVTSYLWSFGVICEIVIFYFQAPILKHNLLAIIKFSIFMTAIRWLLLYLFPENLTITFISQSMHAFSFGLYHSAVIIYLYSLYHNKKLAQQFMLGVAYGLGGFLGALIAGWMYGENLFLYCSIIALMAFFALNIKHKNLIKPA
jgi:PPP family 3-phenylpropionic acid transporter